MSDPFEQFERSRAGMMIPVLLFLVGTLPTAVAIRTLIALESRPVEQVGVDNPAIRGGDNPEPDRSEDGVPPVRAAIRPEEDTVQP